MELGSNDNNVVLRIYKDEKEMFKKWMKEIKKEERRGKIYKVIERNIMKMKKKVERIEMIFEMVEGGREEVGKDEMDMDLGWEDYMRRNEKRIYQ